MIFLFAKKQAKKYRLKCPRLKTHPNTSVNHRLQAKRICLIIFSVMVGIFLAYCKCAYSAEEELVSFFTEHAIPLEKSSDLDALIQRSRNKKLVLLGEASHGTSEYYHWRKKISRRLITEKDFSFIVVEGDWPSCFAINRYVLGLEEEVKGTKQMLRENYQRWPRWMWANEDVVALVDWLKEYNADLPLEKRVGFYGMDVYSMKESAEAVKEYLRNLNEPYYSQLIDKYDTLKNFDYDGLAYARAFHLRGIDARDDVKKVVQFFKENSENLIEKNRLSYFSAKMNAIVVKNAEKYYRTAVLGGADGWNNRVKHMKGVVDRLLDFYGEEAKGIVWAHNTHVGDARATAMRARGQINIGQLSREDLGPNRVLITGFGSYKGTVVAGSEWGAPFEIMTIPPGQNGSVEEALFKVDIENFMLLFDDNVREKEYILTPRGHRAIGVTYNPDVEHMGNYVPTILPLRYDVFLFFKKTQALTPLGQE